MKYHRVGKLHFLLTALVLVSTVFLQSPASASPFGQGVFGADVPFGSNTSLSIALGGNVSLPLTAGGSFFTGSGTNTITVTSTDVIGYRLYAYSPTSATMTMTGGSDTIPASGNVSPAALATNTWGYNTDGSANYVGMKTVPTLVTDAVGPYKNGNPTTLTFAAKTDITKGAGAYTVGVVYTAVGKNP